MKYLKKFELVGKNETQEFNDGDWVYFYDNNDSDYYYGQIIDVYFMRDKVIGDRYYYQIKVTDDYFNNNDYYHNNIQQTFIFRKLTPEEIEEIEIKKKSGKYNL